MQAFCGFTEFVTEETLNASTLSKLREKLGKIFFETLEPRTYNVLIDRKIIKAKGILVDTTVFPENIKYPIDVGLLNSVRKWLVGNIKKIGKLVGKKKRTYARKARQEYIRFSKNRTKTKKAVARARKAMLQYVKGNLGEMKEMIKVLRKKGLEVKSKLINMLKTAEKIYSQQLEMYQKKVHRIAERIVSFHRPYVQPIKRGKQGKRALVYLDGFLFLDHFEHRAFAQKRLLKTHLKVYQEPLRRCHHQWWKIRSAGRMPTGGE
jgi:IS5 family transposase